MNCRRRGLRLALIIVLVGALIGIIRPVAIATENGFDTALLSAFAQEYEQRFGDSLTTYDIEIRFRPENNRISGTSTIVFTNFTGETLDDIAFRLYPNAKYYGDAYVSVTEATLDGAPVEPTYEADKTVMRLPLSTPLPPDGTVEIALTFRLVIADDSGGTFGIFSHDTQRDMWVLADWYPIVAGWDRELGWRVDAPTPAGDPTYSDAAIYTVTVTHPAELTLVASGTVGRQQPRGSLVTETIETGPVRDFTMLLASNLHAVESTVDGTAVRVWSTGDAAAQDAAGWVSDLVGEVLPVYNAEFGQYPYDELDLISTPIRQSVLGVSWSGLVMLSDHLFLNDRSWIDANPQSAAFAITHELGHQWWGNMIGANSNDHSFMTEGLTNALTMGAIETTFGPDVAVALLRQQISDPYLNALRANGDGAVDTRIGQEATGGPNRVALVYGKGALGFLALRIAMGDERFYAAIDEYAETYLYDIATPDDLLAILKNHAPAGVDVATIWQFWFFEANANADIVGTLTAQINARFYADSIGTMGEAEPVASPVS